MNRKLVGMMVLGAEVFCAGYLALIAGLMSAWMMDDDQAFRMTERDWVVEGARRFGIALVVALGFAVLAGLAHRRWVLVAASPVWMRKIPVLLGIFIALASAAGAISFVVSKPFI